jgi:hypothetical protein
MMNTDSPATRSPFFRFLDSFLQERNIKWVLTVGTLILLGSSLMLVTTHWADYTPAWKFLIMLAYTGAVHIAGQWTYHRLILQKTGTVLMTLTVLLLPVMCWALHWVDGAVTFNVVNLVLLGVTFVFSALVARRIFRHFLCGPQPTFLASFLILCLAGAVAPALPAGAAPWASLLLWAVFAAGTIKVNRHVFWLCEEHRTPRIFGFFPILLLGAQFLGVFVLNFGLHVPVEWLGFGCVLVAVPVLLTADAVARVFQQRTGDLARPLPWPIVLPMIVGLVLCAAGLCLAAVGLMPPHSPRAMVPTATLAAAMMAVVAHRTNKQAFVWAMLSAATVAYNFSPVFFQELARQVVQTGAVAVHEARLPYAFYGLTYLPLIAAAIAASRLATRAGNWLFGEPLRAFSTALSCVLLVASLGHAKAMLPVGLVMVALFAAQTALYRDRWLCVPAVAAWFIAAHGVTPFCVGVLGIPLPASATLLCLAAAAALPFACGSFIDRRLQTFGEDRLLPSVGCAPSTTTLTAGAQSAPYRVPAGTVAGQSSHDDLKQSIVPICQFSSVLVATVLAVVWFAWYSGAMIIWPSIALQPTGTVTALLNAGLLFAQSLHWSRRMLSGFAIVFGYVATTLIAIAHGASANAIVSVVTLALLAQWLLSYLFERRPETRVARAFGPANRWLCSAGLALALVLVFLPYFFINIRMHGFLAGVAPWQACQFLIVAWAFDAARRGSRSIFGVLGCVAALGWAGSELVSVAGGYGWRWIPALWVSIAVLALPVAEVLRRRLEHVTSVSTADPRASACRALARPVEITVLMVLWATALLSLGVFTMPMRIAGAVSLAGLLAVAWLRQKPAIRTVSLALVNWQIVALVLVVFGPRELTTILNISSADAIPTCLPVAVLTAVSVLAWQRRFENRLPSPGLRGSDAIAVGFSEAGIFGLPPRVVGQSRFEEIAQVHRGLLRIVAGVAILATFALTAPTATQLLLAGVTFILLVISELWAACRDRDEFRVWIAEAIAGIAVGYFAWQGVIHFGHGTSMFVVLAIAVAARLLAWIAANRSATAIMARPFERTGMILPLATVLIGLYRHATHVHPTWLGMNSLGLLLAAAFYFWRGIERRERRSLVGSAMVLNIALVLLWRELSWSDPQFYMIPIGLTILAIVRLLNDEIPRDAHDPLNYLGALVILVSPTFHIVAGSWLHLFSLMALSVAVVLLAIGFRVRAMMYMGGAFLVADLAAMIVRGSIDNPNLLWFAGVGLGAAVLALGAFAERNRERLLQRLRIMSAALESWN